MSYCTSKLFANFYLNLSQGYEALAKQFLVPDDSDSPNFNPKSVRTYSRIYLRRKKSMQNAQKLIF